MLDWVPAGEVGEPSLVPMVNPASRFPPLGWFFTSKAVNKQVRGVGGGGYLTIDILTLQTVPTLTTSASTRSLLARQHHRAHPESASVVYQGSRVLWMYSKVD